MALCFGQRAQDVVGFVARCSSGCDPVGVENLQDHFHLGTQVVGDFFDVKFVDFSGDTVGLVRRDQRYPPRRTPVQVQTHHQPSGTPRVTNVAMLSMNPRTALTGRPSGAVIEVGTPK